MDQPKKTPDFDVQSGLVDYLPSLSKMIDAMPGNFGWAAINSNWKSNWEILVTKQEKEGPLIQKLTLLKICANSTRGDKTDVHFLKFIDGIFKNLGEFLEVKDYGLIRENIYNFLLFHENFLNYLGELAMLNCILLTKQYKLLATEYRVLDSGPSIDFLVLHIETNKKIPIEIVNITLEDQRFIDNATIARFLRGKFENKLREKDLSGINYTLVPVMWPINTEENFNLERLINFYTETNFQMDRVQTPYVHSSYNNPDGTPVDTFSSIFECYPKVG